MLKLTYNVFINVCCFVFNSVKVSIVVLIVIVFMFVFGLVKFFCIMSVFVVVFFDRSSIIFSVVVLVSFLIILYFNFL